MAANSVDGTMRQAVASGDRRSGALDAIRGVAILMVIARHYLQWGPGQFGVQIFFVLSGYLLAGNLLRAKGKRGYWRVFYIRRAARILPLYLILLTAMFFAVGLELPLWRYLTFTQNFGWVFQARWDNPVMLVTWSLAVEEQFYAVLPALVFWLPARVLRGVCCGAILASFVWTFVLHGAALDAAARILPPMPMGPLCVGVLLASLGVRAPELGRCEPLAWFGRRSYALYLFNVPIEMILHHRLIALASICVMAEASWRWIERPTMRWARSIRPAVTSAGRCQATSSAM